eukprot:998539-Pelagomonas_calceolata.AAC.6
MQLASLNEYMEVQGGYPMSGESPVLPGLAIYRTPPPGGGGQQETVTVSYCTHVFEKHHKEVVKAADAEGTKCSHVMDNKSKTNDRVHSHTHNESIASPLSCIEPESKCSTFLSEGETLLAC